MYAAILISALAAPEQCPGGICPLQRAVVTLTTPLARGGCQGRQARFVATARAPKAGCVGQVAAVAPPAPKLPLPMPPAPVAPPPVVKDPAKAPASPVAASKAPERVKVDIYRPAPVRTFRANRPFAFFACP